MRKTRALWMVAVSVLSTSAFSGVVAHADTISQSTVQSLYANQSQEVDTQSVADVHQNEHTKLKNTSSQTTHTQTGDTSLQSVDQTYSDAQEYQGVKGDYQSDHQQTSDSKSTMVRREKPHSLQIHSKTSIKTKQTSSTQTDGTATLIQSATSVLTGSQLQTVQEQTVSGPVQHVTQTDTLSDPPGTTVDNPFVTLPQPLDGNTTVAGYAIFNQAGYLLSDHYGDSGTNDKNNGTSDFTAFVPNTPTEVIVAAVNSSGQPVVNTQPVTLRLESNGSGGMFLNISTHFSVTSVVLPAGVTGMRVDYQNQGLTPMFDILDASRIYPHRPPIHTDETQTVLGTSQSQSVTLTSPPVTPPQNDVSNVNKTNTPQVLGPDTSTPPPVTTAVQSQQLVVKADNQQAPAVDQQNADITQTGSASQSQKVDVPATSTTGDTTPLTFGDGNSSKNTPAPTNTISEQQDATISSKMTPSNQPQPSNSSSTTTPKPNVSVDQTESSTTTKDVNMAQTESVTVQAPEITVQLNQTQTPSNSGGVTLKQNIAASAPPSEGTNGNTVVNVTINQQSKQYVLDTNGPVTITESQTLDTTSDNTQGSTPSPDATPPVKDTASLEYQDTSGNKVQVPLE